MTLRAMPAGQVFERPRNFQWDAPAEVLTKWAETPQAADDSDANTITIFDVIGEDWWSGGGFTAKRAAAALRSIGPNAVTVKINSPGGDLFEGIAIYNLLRDHPAKVTVEIMGMAASAASIIAMAGDEIRMGLGTFTMIHCAWGIVIGNRHDMREAATTFDAFDAAIVDIYEARTSLARKEIEKLMDAETFMGPTDAVKKGFADAVDEGLKAPASTAESRIDAGLAARRRVEAALAKTGIHRSERSDIIAELVAHAAERDAGRTTAERDAGNWNAALERLTATIRS